MEGEAARETAKGMNRDRKCCEAWEYYNYCSLMGAYTLNGKLQVSDDSW